jgi:Leucine-rich repeat (LRR) protein
LGNLKLLIVDKNGITDLPESIFENLPELRNISFADNKLKTVNKNIFNKNRKIEYVWLESNNIESLDQFMFDSIKNLKFVDLRWNACIHESFFADRFMQMWAKIRNQCEAGGNHLRVIFDSEARSST